MSEYTNRKSGGKKVLPHTTFPHTYNQHGQAVKRGNNAERTCASLPLLPQRAPRLLLPSKPAGSGPPSARHFKDDTTNRTLTDENCCTIQLSWASSSRQRSVDEVGQSRRELFGATL